MKLLAQLLNEMAKLYQKSNSEIEDIMEGMFGDDTDKPYYGSNFRVVDKIEEDE